MLSSSLFFLLPSTTSYSFFVLFPSVVITVVDSCPSVATILSIVWRHLTSVSPLVPVLSLSTVLVVVFVHPVRLSQLSTSLSARPPVVIPIRCLCRPVDLCHYFGCPASSLSSRIRPLLSGRVSSHCTGYASAIVQPSIRPSPSSLLSGVVRRRSAPPAALRSLSRGRVSGLLFVSIGVVVLAIKPS